MSDNWIVQNLENALETWNDKLSEIWALGLMLAVFSSCLSGCSDEESNLVGIMYKRGTHLAIAHTNITSIPNDEIWMIQFMTALKNGKTIYDSIRNTNRCVVVALKPGTAKITAVGSYDGKKMIDSCIITVRDVSEEGT